MSNWRTESEIKHISVSVAYIQPVSTYIETFLHYQIAKATFRKKTVTYLHISIFITVGSSVNDHNLCSQKGINFKVNRYKSHLDCNEDLRSQFPIQMREPLFINIRLLNTQCKVYLNDQSDVVRLKNLFRINKSYQHNPFIIRYCILALISGEL